MSNVLQAPLPPGLNEFKCAVKQCDRMKLSKAQQAEVKSAGSPCAKLGELKHACVDEKMSKVPGVRTERSYDMSKRPPRVVKDASGAEVSGYLAAKAQGIAQGLGPLKRPDAIVGSRAPYDIFDAKFPCSSKVKSGRVDAVNLSARGKGGAGMMSPAQRRSYQRIAKGTSKRPGSVTAVSPADARDAKC